MVIAGDTTARPIVRETKLLRATFRKSLEAWYADPNARDLSMLTKAFRDLFRARLLYYDRCYCPAENGFSLDPITGACGLSDGADCRNGGSQSCQSYYCRLAFILSPGGINIEEFKCATW